MINTNRIVPITAVDLISMYGFVLAAAAAAASGTAPEKLEATNPGEFTVSTNSKTYIANEPVKSLNFASGMTAETIYFVPAYDYQGFTKTSATLTVTGDVDPDSRSLYAATLSTNALTISKVGF